MQLLFAMICSFAVISFLSVVDSEVAESVFLPTQNIVGQGWSQNFGLHLFTFDTERSAIARGQSLIFVPFAFIVVGFSSVCSLVSSFHVFLSQSTNGRTSLIFFNFAAVFGSLSSAVFALLVWFFDFKDLPFTFLEETSVTNAVFRDRASLLITQSDSFAQLSVSGLFSTLVVLVLLSKNKVSFWAGWRVFFRFASVMLSILFLGGEGMMQDGVICISTLTIVETFLFLERVLKNSRRIRLKVFH